jgi:hypothetical protein
MQFDQSLNVRGKWKRWTCYELVNGVVIPAQNAELEEYDPWERYRANFGKYRTVEQPYCSLLELGKHLDREKNAGRRPSKADSKQVSEGTKRGPQNGADKLILDWCNKHGLLGLIPVLSTRIDVTDKVFHYRDRGKWLTVLREIERRKSTVLESQRVESGEEDSFTPQIQRDNSGSLTWLNWVFHRYETTRLAKKRAFFGGSPSDPFTPWRPGSVGFWKIYGEPADEIGDWCTVFAHSASFLNRSSGLTNEGDFLNASHLVLSGLAESSAPHFEFYPERSIVLDEVRSPAGLLASYALMLLWDLVEGRRVLRCVNCDRYFVSDEHRASYCSPRCRNTAQSRRYRETKKTKSSIGG